MARPEPPPPLPALASVALVDDPADGRVAGYLHVRDRDRARLDGTFVVEGEVAVRVALAGGAFEPVSLFLERSRLAKLEDALVTLPPGVPVYAASQAVTDAVVGFPIHRGVLALFRRPEPRSAGALLDALPEEGPLTVLVGLGVSNHDNVGGFFRNAAAFGADAVLLDELSCDPLYRKAVRVSAGGVFRVPFAHAGQELALVSALRRRHVVPLALSPRGASELSSLDLPERVAWLVGAEGAGLSDEVLGAVTSVRVAMAPGFDSLNVAVTSALALHASWVRLLARAAPSR